MKETDTKAYGRHGDRNTLKFSFPPFPLSFSVFRFIFCFRISNQPSRSTSQLKPKATTGTESFSQGSIPNLQAQTLGIPSVERLFLGGISGFLVFDKRTMLAAFFFYFLFLPVYTSPLFFKKLRQLKFSLRSKL